MSTLKRPGVWNSKKVFTAFTFSQSAMFHGRNVQRLQSFCYLQNQFYSGVSRSSCLNIGRRSKHGNSEEGSPSENPKVVSSENTSELAAGLTKFVEELKKDERGRLTVNEFSTLSLDFGFDSASIKNLREQLEKNGVIIDLGVVLDTIVIKPEVMKTTWDKVLDLDGSYTSEFKVKRKAELNALRSEIEPLELQLQDIEQQSERSAVRCMRGLFGYTIVHTWLIAYLTF